MILSHIDHGIKTINLNQNIIEADFWYFFHQLLWLRKFKPSSACLFARNGDEKAELSD